MAGACTHFFTNSDRRGIVAMWLRAACWPLALGAAVASCVPGQAQQPTQRPPLPAINPGQAHLEQTLGGLDGPAFAVAFVSSRESASTVRIVSSLDVKVTSSTSAGFPFASTADTDRPTC